MQREVFDRIFGFPEGTIFLLNLVDSLEIGLLQNHALMGFSHALDTTASTALNWWLGSITTPVTADGMPAVSGGERFVTVVAMRSGGVPQVDPFGDLVREPLLARQVVGDTLASEIFLSRETKKHYWVTDASTLSRSMGADDVRDVLGLDWISEEAELFELTLDATRVAARQPRRPTGLCKGTPRFRARRDDEARHARYPAWGLTVNLAKWRASDGAGRVDVAGVPELVVGVGPIDADCAVPVYVGVTREPSGCTSRADHERFAAFLNGGTPVVADALFSRLARFT